MSLLLSRNYYETWQLNWYTIVFPRRFPPTKFIVSDRFNPFTIVTGIFLYHIKRQNFQYGEYVKTHENNNNSMGELMIESIVL